MLKDIYYTLSNAQTLSNLENFLVNYYIPRVNQTLSYAYGEYFDDDFALDFSESFFDKEKGLFSKNLSQDEVEFLIHCYKNIPLNDFISFENHKALEAQKGIQDSSYSDFKLHQVLLDFTKDHPHLFQNLPLTQTAFENKLLELHSKVKATFNDELKRLDALAYSYMKEQSYLDLKATCPYYTFEEKAKKIFSHLKETILKDFPIIDSLGTAKEDFALLRVYLVKDLLLKSEETLKDLGYEVCIIKDNIKDEEYHTLAFAKDKEALQKAYDYHHNRDDFTSTNTHKIKR